jgi:hypothetical protein
MSILYKIVRDRLLIKQSITDRKILIQDFDKYDMYTLINKLLEMDMDTNIKVYHRYFPDELLQHKYDEFYINCIFTIKVVNELIILFGQTCRYKIKKCIAQRYCAGCGSHLCDVCEPFDFSYCFEAIIQKEQ